MNIMISGSRGLPPLSGGRGRRPLPASIVRAVEACIDNLPDGSTITHGGAEGVDQIAEARAKARGLITRVFRPEYNKYPPRVAPLKRNEEMAATDAEVLFAFAVNGSHGTMHAVKCMLRQGKGVVLHSFDEEGNFLGLSSPYDLS